MKEVAIVPINAKASSAMEFMLRCTDRYNLVRFYFSHLDGPARSCGRTLALMNCDVANHRGWFRYFASYARDRFDARECRLNYSTHSSTAVLHCGSYQSLCRQPSIMFAECSEVTVCSALPHATCAAHLRDHKADPIVLKYLENCVFLGVWWRNVGGFRHAILCRSGS